MVSKDIKKRGKNEVVNVKDCLGLISMKISNRIKY